MNRIVTGVMAVAGMVACPALAQAKGLGVEATGGKTDGQWGAELGASYSMGFGPITVRPVAGAFIPTESGASTSLYAKGEATFTIPAVAELGVGARLAHEKVRPYALAAFPLLPMFKLTLQGGDHYGAAGLRFSF
jgi:hypothetical protein